MNEKSIAYKLFEYLENNFFTLFISREILAEVLDVLSRPVLRAKYSQITDESTDKFLKRVLIKAVFIKNIPPNFRYLRDPKDEKYLDLAIEIKADFIISRDKDLLDLMSGISADAKEFRQKSRPLKIVEPIEFLKIIEKENLALNK